MEKGNELVPMCVISQYLKMKAKAKKEKKNRSNKRLERVEQQRSFYVLAYMLVTLATFHAETLELKTMASRNTA